MASNFRLGIQSYTFRKFQPVVKLVDALKQMGLSYVEIWPGHFGHGDSKAKQDDAFELLRANDITVDSYGQVVFHADEDESRKALEFAKRANVGAVTADVDPDAVELTQALCDEYDINLAVHNHGRNHRHGHTAQLKQLFSKASTRLGLCLDTGWLIDAGEDPLEAVDAFADRIYGVHLKDFTYDADDKREDVIIGTGGLKLPEFISKLKRINYNGYLSIEYEGDADNPLPNMQKCVDAAREAIAAA